jgi:hypothetical protein
MMVNEPISRLRRKAPGFMIAPRAGCVAIEQAGNKIQQGRSLVEGTFAAVVSAGLMGLAVLPVPTAQGAEEGAGARKPIMINRLYTGPDGLTHAEEIEAKGHLDEK